MSELDQEKLHYERLWSMLRVIHGDGQLFSLFSRYGPDVFRRSSVLEGFEEFIKGHGFSGKTCVEIGTLKGLTSLVLSRYFERVVTIDIVDDPQKREIAAMLGVKNIGFVNVRDNEEKAEVLASVQFDSAFVDGDHHKDTDSDFSLVEKCGRVLFHEAWAAQPAVMNLLYGLPGTVITQKKWALWTR